MPSKSYSLDELFHPKSLAVIGASATEQANGWVARQIRFGFAGTIYPVNPRASEISGLKAYPTLRDIPGPVDYVIFNVPARMAPQAMEDCVAKKVKLAHLYTAGFSETGRKEAKELETRVRDIARAGGVRIIGPNCLGLHYPAVGITFNPSHSKESGNVAFVSQSGAVSNRFTYLANGRGLRVSKVISYGNAIDIDSPELLEYLAKDDETQYIGCYIEGVKDGRRFLKAIRECIKTKPVVIFKAGLTEGGAGAAASHTASMGGSESVWNAFFKESGAIQVNALEEVVDAILALQYVPCPEGRRVAVVGRGGGIGVMATDACERAGLKVPPFIQETRSLLEKIIPEVGAGTRNPVETDGRIGGAADFYVQGLKIVEADPQIDFILAHIAVDIYGGRRPDMAQQVMKAAEMLSTVAPMLKKPMVVVLYPGELLETIAAVFEAREKLLKAGVTVYPTIDAAARAVNRLVSYHEFLNGA